MAAYECDSRVVHNYTGMQNWTQLNCSATCVEVPRYRYKYICMYLYIQITRPEFTCTAFHMDEIVEQCLITYEQGVHTIVPV